MKKHSGYSLVELSIALVVLGIVVVLIWGFMAYNARYALSNNQRASLRHADTAVTGFALSHGRLPCPDDDADGREDCASGKAVGTLPFVSIGMPQARAGGIRYGVYRNAMVTGVDDADLATARDRMPLLATQGSPLVGYDEFSGAGNGIDLCVALRNGGNAPDDSDLLHVTTPRRDINVAYAFALPGWHDADQGGGIFDATNDAGGLAFEAPARVTDGLYDDRVVSIGFDRLMGRLGCYGTLALATHAHANAAIMAEIMYQGMQDYKIQLDIIEELAYANYLTAVAAVAIATAAVSAATATITLAVAESLMTTGAMTFAIGLAIAGEVAAIASLTTASIAVGPAQDAWDYAKADVADFATLGFVADSLTLATRVRQHAVAADAHGTWTSW